ncbi:MAG: hypothetical protein WCF84_18710 [Anaerolineae bacterium]
MTNVKRDTPPDGGFQVGETAYDESNNPLVITGYDADCGTYSYRDSENRRWPGHIIAVQLSHTPWNLETWKLEDKRLTIEIAVREVGGKWQIRYGVSFHVGSCLGVSCPFLAEQYETRIDAIVAVLKHAETEVRSGLDRGYDTQIAAAKAGLKWIQKQLAELTQPAATARTQVALTAQWTQLSFLEVGIDG